MYYADGHVQFVSCSATITNPARFMRQMFGVDVGDDTAKSYTRLICYSKNVEEITEDGAPSGRKDYVVWDSPPIDPLDPSLGRQSTLREATRLARFLMERGIRLIVFCTVKGNLYVLMCSVLKFSLLRFVNLAN